MVFKSRKTKQKEILDKELRYLSGFFTAEDLFNSIRKKGIKIGMATIYRFLNEKNEDAQLHSYKCEGRTLYSSEKTNHSHFICKQCGKILKFNLSDVSAIRKSIKGEICHFQIHVYGICEHCKKHDKKNCLC